MAESTVPPVALSSNGALPEAEPAVQGQPGNEAQQVGEDQPADKGIELTAWQLFNFWEAVSHCAEPTDYDEITAMLQKAVEQEIEEENQANAAPVPEKSSEAPAAGAPPAGRVVDEFEMEFLSNKYQIAWTAEGQPQRHPAWPPEFVLVVNNDNTDEPYFQVFRNEFESLIVDTTNPEPRSQAWPERKTDPDHLVYQFGRKYVFGPAALDKDGVPITGSYWQPDFYNFAEHAILGDRLNLKFSESETVKAGNRKLVLENGMKLTYGEINGFGGDFFATNNPICTGADFAQQCQYFKDAYNMLARGVIAKQESRALRRLNQKERDAITNAINTGKSTKQVYKDLASSDPSSVKGLPLTGTDERLIAATLRRDGPNYLRMALLNLDHFGEDAHIAYNAGHTCALQAAATGNLELGYAMNAFADHYLGDCFASGHIRTPRRKLHAPASAIDNVCRSIYALYAEALKAERGQATTYNLPQGVKITGNMPLLTTKLVFQAGDIVAMAPDACSKFMHDEDNKRGLVVYNKRGDQWTAFGDTMLFESANEQNLRFMTQALQASADEVYRAYATRSVTVDPSRFAAWDIAPVGVVEQHSHRPLFTKEGYYRANLDDPYCSEYHDPSSYTPVSWLKPWEWPKGYARIMLALSNSDYFKNL